ncbi:MAG: hypothetical protein ACR2PR_09170 [Pseudohongiellaceae bacterium]
MSIESQIITLGPFSGLSPKTSDAMAANGVASVCRDFFVRGGGLTPMKEPKLLDSGVIDGAAAGGFIFRPSDKKAVFTANPINQMLWREERIIASSVSDIPRQIDAAAFSATHEQQVGVKVWTNIATFNNGNHTANGLAQYSSANTAHILCVNNTAASGSAPDWAVIAADGNNYRLRFTGTLPTGATGTATGAITTPEMIAGLTCVQFGGGSAMLSGFGGGEISQDAPGEWIVEREDEVMRDVISPLRFIPPGASFNTPPTLAAVPILTDGTETAGTASDPDINYAATFVNKWGDETTPIFLPRDEAVREPVSAGIKLTISGIVRANINGAIAVRFYRQSTSGSSYFQISGDVAIPSAGTTVTKTYAAAIPGNPSANPPVLPTFSAQTNTLLIRLFTGEAGIPLAGDASVPESDEDGGLQKIVAMPGGFLAAHSDTWIWFSAVGRPTVWPREYRIRIGGGAKIQTIERSVDSLYVFADGSPPVIITAQYPQSPFITFSEVPWYCVSGGSVINTGHGLFYASRSGIVVLSGTGGRLLTDGMFDAGSFAKYITNIPRAASADGIYYLFSAHATLMIDTQGSGGLQCVELSAIMKDAKHDAGKLYFINAGCLCELFGGDDYLTGEWLSRILKYAHPQTPAAVQVFADYAETTITEHFGGIGSAEVGANVIGGGDVIVDSIQQQARTRIGLESPSGGAFDDITFFNPQAKTSKAGRRFIDELCVRVRCNNPVRSISIAPTRSALRAAP